MQFVVQSVSAHGAARVGELIVNGGLPGALETPLCLLYTRSGAVPHLTSDILPGVGSLPKAAMLPLPSLYGLPGADVLEQFRDGFHKFSKLEDHFLYLSVQDPHCPPPVGYNEEKNTSIWTHGGRRKVTVQDHLKLVKAFRPDVFECLCDSVTSQVEQTPKRIRQSVDRTLRFLDQTLHERTKDEVLQRCAVLGAVEGGGNIEERTRSAMETAKRKIDGFVLEGYDLKHCRENIAASIMAATQILPEDKPRFIHGLHTPEDIFTAVECGLDVFDGSYPYTATEKGLALTFPFPAEAGSHDLGTQSHDLGEQSQIDKCGRFVNQIDLTEDIYAVDFAPILKSCGCYACVNHSRAYIHHLLETKEILARVLLMMHNLSHFSNFFSNLRKALRNGSYAAFKQTCTSK